MRFSLPPPPLSPAPLDALDAPPASLHPLFRLVALSPKPSPLSTGWLHLQLNDNCAPLDAVLVWNAVNSGGTINVPAAISTFDPAYSAVAWQGGLPPFKGGAGQWVVDAGCAARCGLPSNGTLPKGYALKAKLATAAGMVASGEQVAAAEAKALFGKGVKENIEKSVGTKVAAVLPGWGNKTL